MENVFQDSDKDNSESTPKILPLMCLNAGALNDIPARYTITSLPNYEFPAVGVYVDSRIIPGFSYRVRVLPEPVSLHVPTLPTVKNT